MEHHHGRDARLRDVISRASTAIEVETEPFTVDLSPTSLDIRDAVTTAKIEKAQREWDPRDELALICIQSTVNSHMAQAVHIADCTTAYEAFEYLRKICEGNSPFTAYTTRTRRTMGSYKFHESNDYLGMALHV